MRQVQLKIIDQMPKPPKGKKPQGEPLKFDFGGSPERQVYAVKKPEVVVLQNKPPQPSPFDHFEESKSSKPKPVQQQYQPKIVVMPTSEPKKQAPPQNQPTKNNQETQIKYQPKAEPPAFRKVTSNQSEQIQQPQLSAYQKSKEDKPTPPSQVQEVYQQKMIVPLLAPETQAELKAVYESLPEPQGELSFDQAVTRMYESVLETLQMCPIQQQKPQLPSHIFGDQRLVPLVPPLKFSLSKDTKNFEGHFGQFQPVSKGQVIGTLLHQKDNMLDTSLLDSLFTFDTDTLKKQAACDAIQVDKKALMQPKIDRVFQGLSDQQFFGFSSCVELGQEQQTYLINHDLFTGEIQDLTFADQSPAEDLPGLNDDAEIDEILNQANDPFQFQDLEQDIEEQKADSNLVYTDFQNFLTEFKTSILQQKEAQELKQQVAQNKVQPPHEHQANIQQDQDGEQIQIQIDTGNRIEGDEVDEADFVHEEKQSDEIDDLVAASETFQEALQKRRSEDTNQSMAEPSRFNLAVVAKERLSNETALKNLDTLAKTSDEKWVVTDTIDMKNFKELIPDPALEFPFELDDFQKRAIYRLEQGNCVMVAAHTSAGKTAVAEYAIALSRRHMTKTIYTSPIKSLSNQKYRDFKLKFGDVGVLTGDVQLNRNASCLIMTTEVLQAMLYNGEGAVQDVEWVIFDEVHYINDPERGSVWEEVIMKLPDTVSIIMLSATVPNYLEFANWVGRTKQKKVYVQYTNKRPVPLQHHMMLEGKLTLIKDQENAVDQNNLKMIATKRKNLRFGNDQKDKDGDEKKKNDGRNAPNYQAEEEKKQKKIDFKGKAINAKEASMKKMLAKHTGGGGGEGPNQGQNKKKSASFQKTLEEIQKMKLLPCIVFAFSRQGTFDLAEGLDPTMDFTDGYTKGLIRKFIKQKLQRLDEVDRDLPQIQKITKLLVRGIGVHNAGLLQLMKELVEILFSDGYLKVVFATSTFAIGLNLPARCVIFTQMNKFNGSEMSTIEASEYLQMAGRAGRRGKDDRGFSIICTDPELGKIPSNQEFLDLLDSKGVLLSSQLKIDYRTCLNVLKQESGEIDNMLQKSFFANEDMTVKLQNVKLKKQIEPLFEKTKQVNCIKGCPDEVNKVFDLIDKLWDVNYKLNSKMLPEICQVVEVTTAKHILKPMIVIKVVANRCVCIYTEKLADSWPLQYDEKHHDESLDMLKQRNQPKSFALDTGTYAYEYVEVYLESISKFYSNKINVDNLHFVTKNQINEKQLKLIIREYSQIKVLKEDLSAALKKTMVSTREYQAQIIAKMKETKCWGCELISYHVTQIDCHQYYATEMEKINKVLSGGVGEKELDFNTRNAVLMEYKIIDSDLNLLFKGKVAAKATNLILTEFFFSGLISQLTDCELLALLSLFNVNERAGGNVEECAKQYSEAFTAAQNFILKETEKLIALETEKGVIGEDNTIEKRLNFKFYEIVYDWADQKSFAEVIDGHQIDEGLIVKMILSVNRTRQRLQEMASFVGDNSLADRLKAMSDLLNRGIVKMQSLYLEVEQEPQKLNYQDDGIAELKYEESKN